MLAGLTWFGRGSRLKLTGRLAMTLDAPYTYFADTDAAAKVDPSAIDLRLPIAAAVDPSRFAPPSPQCCRYTELDQYQRRYYLDWLRGDPCTAPTGIGFGHLYLCGLERRLLLDRKDVRDAVRAVLRLHTAYKKIGSPRSAPLLTQVSELLWHVLVRDTELFTPADLQALVARHLSLDAQDGLTAAVCYLAAVGEPLPGMVAFPLARQLPGARHGIVEQRAGDELRALFDQRYREQFGRGLPLVTGKGEEVFFYQPVNRSIKSFAFKRPNPLKKVKQFDPLCDLWNSCLKDLKQLSRLKATGTKPTHEVWRSLPQELRKTVDHPLVDLMGHLVAERSSEGGDAIVRPREVAGLIGLTPEAKLTLAMSRTIAEATTEAGYCIEPDPRLSGRAYDDEEPVVLFLNLSDAALDPAKYAAASTMLDVGYAIAFADKEATTDETAVLTAQLQSMFDLNETEVRRLDARRSLRATVPCEISKLSRTLRTLSPAQQELIGRLMGTLVIADGQISDSEIAAMRRVYSAMRWSRPDVENQLAVLLRNPLSEERDDDDTPVTVAPATAGDPGEAIPPPPSDKTNVQPRAQPIAGGAAAPSNKPAGVAKVGLKLDQKRLDEIKRQTQEVARLLTEAMVVDPEPEPPITGERWSAATSSSTSLLQTTLSGEAFTELGDASPDETLNEGKFKADHVAPDVEEEIEDAASATVSMMAEAAATAATELTDQYDGRQVIEASVDSEHLPTADHDRQPQSQPSFEDETPSALPERYADFYRTVIAKTSWSRDSLLHLSKQHGLMLGGAVETINDWSTEAYGGPLLYDDGDTFELELAYLPTTERHY